MSSPLVDEDLSSNEDEEEDKKEGNPISLQPFNVKAHIYVSLYGGTVDAKKKKVCLDQLETRFTLYGFISSLKVTCSWLELSTHVITWWNLYMHIHDSSGMSWKKFKGLIKKQFYPTCYEEDIRIEWQYLQNIHDQFIQEYNTEFQK